MEEWKAVFEEWFPKELNKKSYPIKVSKQYTSNQRFEIYERLTKPQRKLVDKYRRYLINSRFMEENYLATTDWVFADFKINPFFRTSRRQEKLYCDCGRELKVQYIVKSPKTGKILKLGINHFAEHLHVSPAIANSIHQGMTQVDLALDELLWLKQQNIEFPEVLWQEYLFSLYHNRRLKRPYLPDVHLAKRVADFRQAQMPIYLADYQAIEHEIQKISEQIADQPKKSRAKKELFEDFTEELTRNVEEFLTNYRAFLRKDWQAVLMDTKEKLPSSYFDLLIAELRSFNREQPTHQLTEAKVRAQQQRFIQPAIYILIWEKYAYYGFTEGFFDSLPRVIRNGFLKALRRENTSEQLSSIEVKSTSKKLTEQEWQSLAHSLHGKKVAEVIVDFEQRQYVFSEEQKTALDYYQKLEHSLYLEKPEVKALLKELL